MISPTDELIGLDIEAPESWARTKLGDIHQLAYGKSLTKAARNTAGAFPVYGSNGVVGRHDAYLIEGPVLVIGRKGAVGAVSLCTRPCWPIDTTYYVLPNKHVDIRFSFHMFTFLRLNQLDRSTAIPGLNRDDVHKLHIPIPPLAEQHRIVKKTETLFEEIDRGVESLRAAKSALDLYRKSLLKSAFEGRLTAEWRARNPDKLESPEALLARIRTEREERYQTALDDWKHAVTEWTKNGKNGRMPARPKRPKSGQMASSSGLAVPVGWATAPLREIALEAVLGKMLDRQKNRGQPRVYLGNINLRWGSFDMDQEKKMPIEDHEVLRYGIRAGDLIVCEGGEPGRCAVWDGEDDKVFIQKALHRVRFPSSYSPMFVFHFFRFAVGAGLFDKHYTGSTIKHLTGTTLQDVELPVCSPAEQTEIIRILDARLEAVDKLEAGTDAALARADALRQSILKKAFAGQLVPQDPTDEPASALLARIKEDRAAQSRRAPPKPRKRKAVAA